MAAAEAGKLDLNQFKVVREAKVGGELKRFQVEFRELGAVNELGVAETLDQAKVLATQLAERYEMQPGLDNARKAAFYRRAVADSDAYVLGGVLASARAESAEQLRQVGEQMQAVEQAVKVRRSRGRSKELAEQVPVNGPRKALATITAPESMAFLEQASALFDPEWDEPAAFAKDVTDHWLKQFETPKPARTWLEGWTEKTRPMDSDSPGIVKMLVYRQFLLPKMQARAIRQAMMPK